MRTTHDFIVRVRISKADHELLDAISRRRGIPRATLARSFLRQVLEEVSHAGSLRRDTNVGRVA